MASAGTDCVLGTPHPNTPEPASTHRTSVSLWRAHHEAAPCEGAERGGWQPGHSHRGRVVLRQQPPVPVLAEYKSLLTSGAHKRGNSLRRVRFRLEWKDAWMTAVG